MENPLTGGIRSREDYRDRVVAGMAGAPVPSILLPASYIVDLGKPLMQGKEPACVSHDVVYLIRKYWFKKTGKWIDFSPRFLDILSAEADIPLDGGRRPRTVLKLAASVGCCTTATLPNDTTLPIGQYRDPSVITQAMRDEAAKYRIPGFIFVATDKASIRKGIFLYDGVTCLFEIGIELWTSPAGTTSWADADVDPLRPPAQVVSGHQMAPCGWTDESYNVLLNQWSEAWAAKGYAKYDPVAWGPYTAEAWAVAEIPYDVKAFLANLPSPSDFHYVWNADLHYGAQGEDVKFVQVALMILGYMGAVDPSSLGIYGPKTMAAVGAFQKAQGISPQVPTAIGPRTRQALNARFAL